MTAAWWSSVLVYRSHQHFLLLDWVLAEAKNFHGVTHQSKARDDSTNHFGHRFTLDVSKSWHSDAEFIPTSLLFLLEVYDVNMWNRQKSVGYGFTHVPLSPGSYSVAVPTWRPHITTSTLKLQEYFLGLAPQIQNIKYAGIPDDVSRAISFFLKKTFFFLKNQSTRQVKEDGSVFSRFPFETEASGLVQLRFDTMMQRGRDVLEQQQIRASINRHRPSATSSSVEEVIQAYHRAKQRLKAAHDALLR